MLEWLSNNPSWGGAVGLVIVHSIVVTRPVIKLWRNCENDKQSLREEHRTDKAQLLERIEHLEDALNTTGE